MVNVPQFKFSKNRAKNAVRRLDSNVKVALGVTPRQRYVIVR